jgi:hypothetical protein
MKFVFCILLISFSVFSGQQVPHTFSANTTAKASEVNNNFNFILSQIDSLRTQNQTFKTRCDSLAGVAKATNDSLAAGKTVQRTILDSLNASKAFVKAINDSLTAAKQRSTLPVGTIVASMLDSASFRQIAGDGWVLADGRSTASFLAYFQVTGKANLPDLRGMFLRGLNAGRNDGRQDPETRLVSGYQEDAFQGHWHSFNSANGTVDNARPLAGSQGSSSDPGTYNSITNPIADGTNGVPRTGSETRPKNVAVYYYIKVK